VENLRATLLLAVREAGRIQLERRAHPIEVSPKGFRDLVTEVDHAVEEHVFRLITERHPDHAVLGEEEAEARDGEPSAGRSAPALWILDPLDGTKNYAHGYGRSCVSLAYAERGLVRLGAVYNPAKEELFFAEAGRGATLNGAPIHVSSTSRLDRAMVSTALTVRGRFEAAQLERIARLLGSVEAVRSDGSAALDLCDVAAGRFECFFEPGLAAWDVAAGGLIVAEAGGRVTRRDGSPHQLFGRDIVASNGILHPELLGLIGP
jgi:myo-inositol-1(or 4)-monophosphatase